MVAVVGAGPVGGELAFLLARRDAVESIVLVDDSGTVAAGKALDILQAGPIAPFSARVSGSTDPFVAAGASIVVLADSAKAGEWPVEAALQLLGRIVRAGRSTVVICAGVTHAPVVHRAVRELRMSRRQVFGTAPEALASGIRSLAALEVDRSPEEIALTVLGVPPHHVVIPWSDGSIGGFSMTRLLDEPARRRLAARSSHLWPPGPLSLASAAAAGVLSVVGQSRRSLTAFVAPDEMMGSNRRTGAMPVVLGPEGIDRIEMPPLAGSEQVALDNALLL